MKTPLAIILDDISIKRFNANVFPEPMSGCWLWDGYYGHNGYGSFHLNGKQYRAHRVSYTLHRGEIPENKQLDHLCRNRACVNPDHPEPVTRRENILRGSGITAENLNKTHCKRGHLLTEGNLRKSQSGRSCLACYNEIYIKPPRRIRTREEKLMRRKLSPSYAKRFPASAKKAKEKLDALLKPI